MSNSAKDLIEDQRQSLKAVTAARLALAVAKQDLRLAIERRDQILKEIEDGQTGAPIIDAANAAAEMRGVWGNVPWRDKPIGDFLSHLEDGAAEDMAEMLGALSLHLELPMDAQPTLGDVGDELFAGKELEDLGLDEHHVDRLRFVLQAAAKAYGWTEHSTWPDAIPADWYAERVPPEPPAPQLVAAPATEKPKRARTSKPKGKKAAVESVAEELPDGGVVWPASAFVPPMPEDTWLEWSLFGVLTLDERYTADQDRALAATIGKEIGFEGETVTARDLAEWLAENLLDDLNLAAKDMKHLRDALHLFRERYGWSDHVIYPAGIPLRWLEPAGKAVAS